MELPFFTTSAAGSSNAAATRSEALRWLAIGEKLLAGRDLVGSKSFASRARESDPTLVYADQIIAVADTLLAGDKRINNTPDWYAVLQLSPQQSLTDELVSNQYRKLALLLNPQKNKLPFADQAFALIVNAWQVLSNPSKKLIYDNELVSYFRVNPNPSPVGTGFNPFSPGIIREQQPPPPQHQQQQAHQQQQHFNYQPYEINFQVMQPQPQQAAPPPQPPQHHQHTPMDTREHQMFQQQQRGFREPPPSMMVPQLHLTPEAINQHTFQQNVNQHQQVQQPQSLPQTQPMASYQPQQQQYQNEEMSGNNVTHNLTHNFSGLFGDSSNNDNTDNANAMPDDDDDYNHNENENGNEEDGGVQENVGNGSQAGEEGRGVEESPENRGSNFWTACPYCFYMFEYPSVYEGCALKCQNCKRVFEGVMIASPPPIVDGQEAYFCCWGMMPMGVSMDIVQRNSGDGGNWTPFSPMFSFSKGKGSGGGNPGSWGGFGAWNNSAGGPSGGNFGNYNPGGGGSGYGGGGKNKSSGPRVYVDDDDVFLEYSDPSGAEDDGDWRSQKTQKTRKTQKTKKKAKSAKKASGVLTQNSGTPGKRGRGRPPKVKVTNAEMSGTENSMPQDFADQEGTELGNSVAPAVEVNKKGAAPVVRRHSARVAKEFGKLDLNVEFNNDVEEPAAPRVNQANGTGRGDPRVSLANGTGRGDPRVSQAQGTGRGEDDIIEGSGFFEGLDEFLSTLPILNAVGDDKIKAA